MTIVQQIGIVQDRDGVITHIYVDIRSVLILPKFDDTIPNTVALSFSLEGATTWAAHAEAISLSRSGIFV